MRYVIVGASAAGFAAAEAILDVDPSAEVTVVSEEADPPYCRPLISYWIAGETPEELFSLRPLPDRAELRLGSRATFVDPAKGELHLAFGEVVGYDRLLLATGAASATLGIPGEGLPNARGFRTQDDARAVDVELRAGAERAVVLGGGLVGVKAAHALAVRGAATTLCIASDRPLSQVADETAGRLVAEALAEEGVDVRLGMTPTAIEERDGRAVAVAFASGQRLACDLVVVGKGVTPRAELLERAGPGGAIAVDETLRTALPRVWAAGDCVQAPDVAWGVPRVNAVWPLAAEQGTLAGRNMAGAAEVYAGGVAMNSLRMGSLELVTAGITRPPDSSYEELSSLDSRRRLYRKVVVKDGRVVGALVADQAAAAGLLVSAIRRGARLDELPFDPLDVNLHWGRYAFGAAAAPAVPRKESP